jgi:hypothetical protein
MSTMEPDEGAQPDDELDSDADNEGEDEGPARRNPPGSSPDRPAWQ